MGGGFFQYIEKLELQSFFSGYPIAYMLVLFMSGVRKTNPFNYVEGIQTFLSYGYALTGTLFLGFELRKWYRHDSTPDLLFVVGSPYLIGWGLSAVLFWIPALSKKTIISFVHSLPFFLLFLKDIILRMNSAVSREDLRNDMITYSLSIILNLISLLIVYLANLLFRWKRKK